MWLPWCECQVTTGGCHPLQGYKYPPRSYPCRRACAALPRANPVMYSFPRMQWSGLASHVYRDSWSLVQSNGLGMAWFHFTDRVAGASALGPILTYVFPTCLRHGASYASRGALPWRALGHLGLSTHHNPSPPTWPPRNTRTWFRLPTPPAAQNVVPADVCVRHPFCPVQCPPRSPWRV